MWPCARHSGSNTIDTLGIAMYSSSTGTIWSQTWSVCAAMVEAVSVTPRRLGQTPGLDGGDGGIGAGGVGATGAGDVVVGATVTAGC